MQAVARALLWLGGCSRIRRVSGERFCSSQPWFGPPFLVKYGETDPNAPGVVASPWSPGNVGINRSGVPPPAAHSHVSQYFPPPALGAPKLGIQHPAPSVRAPETTPSSEGGATEVFASLIEFFQRKGMLQEVDSLFRGMKDNHIVLSLPTYRTLMDSFAQQGDLERMDMVYLEMRKATMQSAGYPQPELTEQKKLEVSEYFANIADSCYKKGLLEEVQHIHRAMKAAQLSISLRMYNILINTYSQLRDCRSMDAVYVEMREALAQRRVNASATMPPNFPGAVRPPPVFAVSNPGLGQHGESFQAGNRPQPGAAPWPGAHGSLQSPTLPPGSQFQIPSSHQPSPGSQFQVPSSYQPSPGNVPVSQFQVPRHLTPPPPPLTPPGQPFRPPSPGQYPQTPGPGHQHFQPPAPGTAFQYPGHLAPVPGYPPGVYPGTQFQFQPGQVAVPLAAQQFQAPPSAQQLHVQPPATVQVPTVEEPSASAEEEVEEEVSAETEEAPVEEPEAEAADGEVQGETMSGEEGEAESSVVDYQESVGDSTENVGVEALESMVTGEEQPQQQQLMEGTG